MLTIKRNLEMPDHESDPIVQPGSGRPCPSLRPSLRVAQSAKGMRDTAERASRASDVLGGRSYERGHPA